MFTCRISGKCRMQPASLSPGAGVKLKKKKKGTSTPRSLSKGLPWLAVQTLRSGAPESYLLQSSAPALSWKVTCRKLKKKNKMPLLSCVSSENRNRARQGGKKAGEEIKEIHFGRN